MSSDRDLHPVSGSIFRVLRGQMFKRRTHSCWSDFCNPTVQSLALGKDPRTQFNGSTIADRVKSGV